jgi:hypothetical protein
VTMLVCFVYFCTRGCGRSGRPAFPAPSDLQEGRTFTEKLARIRGEIAKPCLKRRSCLKIESVARMSECENAPHYASSPRKRGPIRRESVI